MRSISALFRPCRAASSRHFETALPTWFVADFNWSDSRIANECNCGIESETAEFCWDWGAFSGCFEPNDFNPRFGCLSRLLRTSATWSH
jgi:hypothetical protein